MDDKDSIPVPIVVDCQDCWDLLRLSWPPLEDLLIYPRRPWLGQSWHLELASPEECQTEFEDLYVLSQLLRFTFL